MVLISKQFLKSVPQHIKSNIIKKLQDFQNVLQDSEGKIRDIPAGYWIRKVKNTEIFKFRLNNSDRILFTFLPRRETPGINILFLKYVSHDQQIKDAKHLNVNQVHHSQLNINMSEFDDEEIDNRFEAKLENEYVGIEINDIPAIVVEEPYITSILEEDNEDFLYYVTEEQNEPLKHTGKPLILSGAGGTGKTVVLLNKLMSLKEKNIRAAYLSYNNLLVEDIRRIYQKYSNDDGKFTPHFFSIKKFYAKHCPINENQIVNYYDFVDWFKKERYKFRGIKEISELAIWTEIRGIIKGYLGLEYTKVSFLTNECDRLLTFDQYNNLPRGYSNFSTAEKEAIYKVALQYQSWLTEENLYDENDLAMEIIREIEGKKIEQYQYLVVDEVQDLSETQLYMVSKLVKDGSNIFFGGDVHQTINPTFFNFGRIKNLYYTNGLDVEDFQLTKNYRNTKEIVDLANKLANHRQKLIGKTAYDYKTTALRSGKAPVVMDLTTNNLDYIFNTIKDKHFAALIVADEEEKDALIQKYSDAKGRIFTIYEIKGLEYETIFCYNIMSKYENAWKQILKGNAKRNDQYRYYFNLLYVAISRARSSLCIMESNQKLLPADFLEACNHVVQASLKELNLSKTSTKKDWAKEAERLEVIGNIEKSKLARDYSKEQYIQNINEHFDRYMITDKDTPNLELNIQKDDTNLREGITFLRLQKYNQAVQKLNRFIEDYPQDPDGYYYLGLVYTYAASGTDYSIRYFDEAIKLKRDWYEVYLDKAASLKYIGEKEAAITTLDCAIDVNNKIGNAFFMKGLLYLDKNLFKKAESCFLRAIELPCYTFDSTNKVWNTKPLYEEEKNFKESIRNNYLIHCTNEGSRQRLLVYEKQQRKHKKLVKPNQSKSDVEINYSLFVLDKENNFISGCMEGKKPLQTTYNSKSKKYVVVFDKEECHKCDNFTSCPMSSSNQGGELRLRKKLLY